MRSCSHFNPKKICVKKLEVSVNWIDVISASATTSSLMAVRTSFGFLRVAKKVSAEQEVKAIVTISRCDDGRPSIFRVNKEAASQQNCDSTRILATKSDFPLYSISAVVMLDILLSMRFEYR